MPLFTFVRHGESECNQRVQNPSVVFMRGEAHAAYLDAECSQRHGGNPSLTPQGRKDAKKVGTQLVDHLTDNLGLDFSDPPRGSEDVGRDWKKDPPRCLFLCSDLTRCVETAELALQQASKRVRWLSAAAPTLQFRPDLREHVDRAEDVDGSWGREYEANIGAFVNEMYDMGALGSNIDHVFVFCHSHVIKSIVKRLDKNHHQGKQRIRLSVYNGGFVTLHASRYNFSLVRLFDITVKFIRGGFKWPWQ